MILFKISSQITNSYYNLKVIDEWLTKGIVYLPACFEIMTRWR